jgi:hypothetical protein
MYIKAVISKNNLVSKMIYLKYNNFQKWGGCVCVFYNTFSNFYVYIGEKLKRCNNGEKGHMLLVV